MGKISTFLMFVGKQCGKAEEAVQLYTALIPNSEVKAIENWNKGEAGGIAGQVKRALFTSAGQDYMASENPAENQYALRPPSPFF